MLKLVFLLNVAFLTASFSLEKRFGPSDCHYHGVDHSKGSVWCDPDRCGFCHCYDVNVVTCENTVSSTRIAKAYFIPNFSQTELILG